MSPRQLKLVEEITLAMGEWMEANVPPGARGWVDGVKGLRASLAVVIAKRDERIEALERRLAALEGDAK